MPFSRPQPSQATHQSTVRGFTILELIIALAVTVLMVFMISALFTATSDGVSVGMAISDVIGAGRAIGDQLERDAAEQRGPVDSPAGVLVIVCQKQAGMPYVERRNEKIRDVRVDQFMFIRAIGNSSNGFGSAPITPTSDATFNSATKTEMGASTELRVWYGHVLKTNEAGTTATPFGAVGANRIANNLVLGRHVLFFHGGIVSGMSVSAPAINHAVGASANSQVSTHVTKPGGGTASLFHGITDVAYLTYSGNPEVAPGAFVAAGAPGSGTYANTLWEGDSESNYHGKALAHMFLDNQRLWVNPYPRAVPADDTTWVTSGQIAQMHPILMDNISDFIVEFAADAVPDADVANDDALGFDGEPDTNADGDVVWYGLASNPATNSLGPPDGAAWTRGAVGLVSPVVASVPGGGVAYVFRHGGNGNEKLWPYMIRIRYRIHDARGELLGDRSPEPENEVPPSKDGAGTNVGRWFEQIIKVKRN